MSCGAGGRALLTNTKTTTGSHWLRLAQASAVAGSSSDDCSSRTQEEEERTHTHTVCALFYFLSNTNTIIHRPAKVRQKKKDRTLPKGVFLSALSHRCQRFIKALWDSEGSAPNLATLLFRKKTQNWAFQRLSDGSTSVTLSSLTLSLQSSG